MVVSDRIWHSSIVSLSIFRYVPAPQMVVRQTAQPTVTPAGQEYTMAAPATHINSTHTAQVEMLMRENERLRQELDGYSEKTTRLTKVS